MSTDLKNFTIPRKRINKESTIISENFIEDVLYREVGSEITFIVAVPDEPISDVFTRNSCWQIDYSVNWSRFAIDEFNKSFFGFIVEQFHSSKSEEDFTFLTECADKVEKHLLKNKKFTRAFSKKCLKDFKNIYKTNKYKIGNVEDIGLTFKEVDHKREKVFVPNISIFQSFTRC